MLAYRKFWQNFPIIFIFDINNFDFFAFNLKALK